MRPSAPKARQRHTNYMGSYLDSNFTSHIKKDTVHTIVELGSRDLHDAVQLYNTYTCPVYAFECNKDCLDVCHQTMNTMTAEQRTHIYLIESAVSVQDGPVSFYPCDLSTYNNMGASSMLKLDFTNRDPSDTDYGRSNVQTTITVPGVRLDTFMVEKSLKCIDLLCMDLQGYELMALMSLGEQLKNVKYIITECQMKSTYKEGVDWLVLYEFLKTRGFKYVCSDKFRERMPANSGKFCEFNALFIRNDLL